MATSGSYNYKLTRDKIIKRAMHRANIVNMNQAARADDHEYAVDIFQGLLKLWQAEGIQMWKRKQATLFPAKQDEQYAISSSTSDHVTNSYVNTTLSAAEASGQTILSVTSSTGMTAADNVGIELDDGTRQWTTIASVDSSTQITVDVALTDDAASGNTVVTYTSKINDRPLRILDMRSVDIANDKNSIPMQMIGYDEYFNIPVKTTDGRPNNFYYDKLLDNGQIYLFPRPDEVNQVIEFTYHEQWQDVDNSTDDIDIPQEWTLPLIYGLAAELAVAYGKFQEFQILEGKAREYKETVRQFDNDEADFHILPDTGECC